MVAGVALGGAADRRDRNADRGAVVAGPEIIAEIKGRTMMVGHFESLFSAPMPA